MGTPKNTWPRPIYNPGPQKHLHALGVISVCYNAFEQELLHLYRHHLETQKVPAELIDLNYFRLDEQRRLKAVEAVFHKYERDQKVVAIISNLVAYFDWCAQTRNTLLHAAAQRTIWKHKKLRKIYLAKRKSRTETALGYITLDLKTLRQLADQIEVGHQQARRLTTYIDFRDIAIDRRPLWLRAAGTLQELPAPLVLPPALSLLDHPDKSLMHPPRRKPSRR